VDSPDFRRQVFCISVLVQISSICDQFLPDNRQIETDSVGVAALRRKSPLAVHHDRLANSKPFRSRIGTSPASLESALVSWREGTDTS
jgi:hypothetical protein